MGKATGEKVPLATRVTIQALRDQGHSINSIAKRCGIHHSTVNAVLASDTDAIELRAAARLKEALPAALRIGAAKIVDHITQPEVIARASLRDGAVAMGILIDKARLEAGETTGNVGLVLQIQAQADNDYMASLKAQAIPAEIVPPAPALPEPPAVVEAPKAEKVQACPAKRKKSNAR